MTCTTRVSRVLLFFRGCQLPVQVDASGCGRVEMAGNSRPRMSLPKSVGRADREHTIQGNSRNV